MISFLPSYNLQSLGVRFLVTLSMSQKAAANRLSSLEKKPHRLESRLDAIYLPQLPFNFRSHLSGYFSSLSIIYSLDSDSIPVIFTHTDTHTRIDLYMHSQVLAPFLGICVSVFAWNVLVLFLALIISFFHTIAYFSVYLCALFSVFTLWTMCSLKVFL